MDGSEWRRVFRTVLLDGAPGSPFHKGNFVDVDFLRQVREQESGYFFWTRSRVRRHIWSGDEYSGPSSSMEHRVLPSTREISRYGLLPAGPGAGRPGFFVLDKVDYLSESGCDTAPAFLKKKVLAKHRDHNKSNEDDQNM